MLYVSTTASADPPNLVALWELAMWEGSKGAFEGFMLGQAGRLRREAQSSAAVAEVLVNVVKNRQAQAQTLAAENEELRSRIAQLEMIAAGRKAVVDAFLQHHPGSPLTADTGGRFGDGEVKQKRHLIYHAAHDARGREMGITNPAEWRQD